MKIWKKLKKLVKKNFKYSMKKIKKENLPDLSRSQAWAIDTALYADKDGDTWSVYGDNSGFCYREGMDKEFAKDYAKELNQNKINTMDI